ncbi:signal peptidase II [Malaciobacter molluscorum LMG 25693]|uniref:Lipoprotein signal peptidase n=1 Tax=Malaciobacter molluscorum LMG 25693 TaxID=870501 RepID=A0A2G1DF32_9BACT|nr:signal peptidase II [Malaciobacter molluscorum]AXX91232.1 prolipoprotein signal peptidase II [Malaciobacter molluscorum LMG 25693]PHO17091.1 signal peptidase II [Malaciobacter molluscorum LMG 25693]
MKKIFLVFFIFATVFIIDQFIKYGFVYFDWGYEGKVLSLQLAYNYGVAFSMFSFLKEYLKFIQLIMLFVGVIYLYFNKSVFYKYFVAIGLLYAGGLSNILDRFTYGAVVDYIYWHYGFEFAIFNFADMIINLAVAIIIYQQLFKKKDKKTSV